MFQTVARLAFRVGWAGALVLAVGAAHAQFNQYLHKNSVHTSLTFADEEAAHADILASGGANQFLTEKAGVTSVGVYSVGQLWKAPKKDPVYTDDWVYNPGSYATEAAKVAALYDAMLAGIAPCAIELWQVDANYTTTGSFLGLPTRQWKYIHYKHETRYWDSNNQVYGCVPSSPESLPSAVRTS